MLFQWDISTWVESFPGNDSYERTWMNETFWVPANVETYLASWQEIQRAVGERGWDGDSGCSLGMSLA